MGRAQNKRAAVSSQPERRFDGLFGADRGDRADRERHLRQRREEHEAQLEQQERQQARQARERSRLERSEGAETLLRASLAVADTQQDPAARMKRTALACEQFLLDRGYERWGGNGWIKDGDEGTCYDTNWALDTEECGLNDESRGRVEAYYLSDDFRQRVSR